MPYDEVMHKWKAGQLHSGSKSGPIVRGQKQAVAIMLSEKRAAGAGKKEYQPKKYQQGGPITSGVRPKIPRMPDTDAPDSYLLSSSKHSVPLPPPRPGRGGEIDSKVPMGLKRGGDVKPRYRSKYT